MNTNISSINKFHFGIYGILLKNNSILLVTKSRGPYTGKLDLPGGKPEHAELPKQTLCREILEETGVLINRADLFENYSTVGHVIENGQNQYIHHLGMVYTILSYDDSQIINEMNEEDSLGCKWYPIESLTASMLSPFAIEVVAKLKEIAF